HHHVFLLDTKEFYTLKCFPKSILIGFVKFLKFALSLLTSIHFLIITVTQNNLKFGPKNSPEFLNIGIETFTPISSRQFAPQISIEPTFIEIEKRHRIKLILVRAIQKLKFIWNHNVTIMV